MNKISVITPCFNEENNVVDCARELRNVMEELLPMYDYEHIFADNASTDGTLRVLKELAESDPKVKIIVNSRNVGPFNNMWNAMKSSTGEMVIPLLPADLQDPPSVLPAFVDNWEKGFLIVFGIRNNRQEGLFMKLCRKLYYKIVNRFASSDIPVDAGEFLLADRKIINSILEVNDHYPYIRGLIAQTGVKYASVEYNWGRRKIGKSKNSFLSLIDQAINGFVSTSRLPARMSLLAGFVLSILGLIFALITVFTVVTSDNSIPVGIPTIIVGIFFLGGVQLFFLGLIGEYVLSVHGQVRRSPAMFEIERINFNK